MGGERTNLAQPSNNFVNAVESPQPATRRGPNSYQISFPPQDTFESASGSESQVGPQSAVLHNHPVPNTAGPLNNQWPSSIDITYAKLHSLGKEVQEGADLQFKLLVKQNRRIWMERQEQDRQAQLSSTTGGMESVPKHEMNLLHLEQQYNEGHIVDQNKQVNQARHTLAAYQRQLTVLEHNRRETPQPISDEALQEYQVKVALVDAERNGSTTHEDIQPQENHALQDYQMQLELLEQIGHKKRPHGTTGTTSNFVSSSVQENNIATGLNVVRQPSMDVSAMQDYGTQLLLLERHNKRRRISQAQMRQAAHREAQSDIFPIPANVKAINLADDDIMIVRAAVALTDDLVFTYEQKQRNILSMSPTLSSAASKPFVDASVLTLQRRLTEDHQETIVNKRKHNQEVWEKVYASNNPSPKQGYGNPGSSQHFPNDNFKAVWHGNYQAMKLAIENFEVRCVHTSTEELEIRIRPTIKTFAEMHTGIGVYASNPCDFYHKGLVFAHQFMDLHEKSGASREVLERDSWLMNEIREQLYVTHKALMSSLLKQPSDVALRRPSQQVQSAKETWLQNSVQAQLAAREKGDHQHFCAKVGCKREYSVNTEWTRVSTPRREGSIASDWTEIGSPDRLGKKPSEVHGGSRELPIRSVLANRTAANGTLPESEDWEDFMLST